MSCLLRIGGRTKYRLRYELHLERKDKSIDSSYIEEAIRNCIGSSHIKLYSVLVSTSDKLVVIKLSFPPRYSLEQTVRRIKMSSRNYLAKRGFSLEWARGYFCKTI